MICEWSTNIWIYIIQILLILWISCFKFERLYLLSTYNLNDKCFETWYANHQLIFEFLTRFQMYKLFKKVQFFLRTCAWTRLPETGHLHNKAKFSCKFTGQYGKLDGFPRAGGRGKCSVEQWRCFSSFIDVLLPDTAIWWRHLRHFRIPLLQQEPRRSAVFAHGSLVQRQRRLR